MRRSCPTLMQQQQIRCVTPAPGSVTMTCTFVHQLVTQQRSATLSAKSRSKAAHLRALIDSGCTECRLHCMMPQRLRCKSNHRSAYLILLHVHQQCMPLTAFVVLCWHITDSIVMDNCTCTIVTPEVAINNNSISDCKHVCIAITERPGNCF